MKRTKTMKRIAFLTSAVALAGLLAGPANAEILAMVNYESKPKDSLKGLKMPVGMRVRREGIAIIDVDPKSPNFGKIMKNIKLPPDHVAHHIFYNRDQTKAYLTSLAKSELRVIDMTNPKFPMKRVLVPDCQAGEDVVFSDDNKTWYYTCMGTNRIIVGNAETDEVTKIIGVPKYPHGIAIHDGIDRILTTSTVRASDLKDPGTTISEIVASTGQVLRTYETVKGSKKGLAPVEVLFVPGSNPPVAYITNMFGGSLSTAKWNPVSERFDVGMAFDFGPTKTGIPLEIYFTPDGQWMYVTTAKPGHFHIFDIKTDASRPRLIKSIATGEGAHHVGFTKDWQYAIVQNSFLNLPGMSDGSISVIDLKAQKVVATVDTLKKAGYNPNSLVLLPKWNHLAGH